MRRIVLDTNVVLDWLVFDDPSVRALAGAIESSQVEAVTCEDCLEELRRVLAYPQFRLDEAGRAAALARYVHHVDRFKAVAPRSPLPSCTDPDDQKFLELAWHAKADLLVTKDKALLRMARRVAGFRKFAIVKPAAAMV